MDVLRDTPVWHAIVEAWRHGAALAGSSAGAMAFGEWSLIRKAHPGDAARRYKPALNLVPRVVVAPHFAGIDERSAAVWDGQVWTARGSGSITFVTPRDRAIYASGGRVPLPSP